MKIKKVLLSFMLLFTSFISLDSLEYNLKVKAQDNEEIGASGMVSNVKNLNLKGFVGTNLKNNVKYWQKNAYKDNPNIVKQIDYAAHDVSKGQSLTYSFGTDFGGVDKTYDIDIYNKDGHNVLGWKVLKTELNSTDRDIRYGNNAAAITNWQGAKELWLNIDASEIDGITEIRFALEDNYSGRESYSLIDGKEVVIYNGNERSTSNIRGNGFIPLPVGFVGYVIIPLNTDYYKQYWNGGSNNIFDLGNIFQFQIGVKINSSTIDKTFYIKEIDIAGNLNESPLPIAGYEHNYTIKNVWDFDKVYPKTENKSQSGLFWYGEFVGKLLTGMAYSYKATANEDLLTSANEIIKDLKNAQGEDGYLGVFAGGSRFSLESENWDLWNQYHCICGLLEWYKLTNSADALEIAIKCIECIYSTFKDRSYIVTGGFETNRAIAHAYAQLYQVTKIEKYLNEAIRIIENDCQDFNGWYRNALMKGHFYKSSSARWEVLHMIMTLGILYEETGRKEYYDVMNNVWYDILDTDIHNTGGFTTNEAAQGDPYMEGIIETCCSIAWQAFSNEFYRYSKKVEVVDEIERTYMNAILGSLLDDDKYCTYNSPTNGVQGTCGSYDGRKVSSQQDIAFQYNEYSKDMNCCQANFARGIGQISEWAALTDKNALYLNYYGNSEIETVVNYQNVTIKQVSSYPLNGQVKITILGLDKESEFDLKLRIPTWSEGSTVEIDGKTYKASSGEYYSINRKWNNNDTLTLNLNVDFHYWTGTKSQLGKTSIYYGPILLTLDEYFNEDNGFNKNVEISSYDLSKSTIESGAAYGALLFVNIENDKKKVRLVDFASAGKYNGQSLPSTYYSWLNVSDLSYVQLDAINRWKLKTGFVIDADENIKLDKIRYNPNDIVEFTIDLPDGYEIDQILENSNLNITSKNGIYSFKMPSDDVTIKVTFKEVERKDEPSEEPSIEIESSSETPSPSTKKGCKGINGTSSLALISILVLLKKKKNK